MLTPCDLEAQYKAYQEEIDQAVLEVLRSGHFILGPRVLEFEENFSKYIGSSYAIGAANGTDTLILAMRCLDIGPGDEVITTPFTAIPTVSAIIARGATPVFADINPETYLVDLELVKNKIGPQTKAFIPVHIFGNVVDVSNFEKTTGIPVIEDACQAHGSKINGQMAGNLGRFGCFSFYPTKNLGGCGDGGMMTTNGHEEFQKLKLLRQYGMVNRDTIVINGINSRLDEIQAAILNIKLKHLDVMNARRREIANFYNQNLDSEFFTPQKIPSQVESNFHVYAITVTSSRNDLVSYLASKGIQTNVYYRTPLPYQEANRFLEIGPGSLPMTEDICSRVLSLPIYPELSNDDARFIVETCNDFWRKT